MMKINKKGDQAYIKALNRISFRLRSVFEIRTFLTRSRYTPKTIETVIKKLVRQGYLNDNKFAESFVSSYKDKKGPRLIKAKLTAMGVDPSIIESSLKSLYSPKEILATAKAIIQKKHFDLNDLKQRFKAKNLLLRHGFPSTLINKLIS